MFACGSSVSPESTSSILSWYFGREFGPEDKSQAGLVDAWNPDTCGVNVNGYHTMFLVFAPDMHIDRLARLRGSVGRNRLYTFTPLPLGKCHPSWHLIRGPNRHVTSLMYTVIRMHTREQLFLVQKQDAQ